MKLNFSLKMKSIFGLELKEKELDKVYKVLIEEESGFTKVKELVREVKKKVDL